MRLSDESVLTLWLCPAVAFRTRRAWLRYIRLHARISACTRAFPRSPAFPKDHCRQRNRCGSRAWFYCPGLLAQKAGARESRPSLPSGIRERRFRSHGVQHRGHLCCLAPACPSRNVPPVAALGGTGRSLPASRWPSRVSTQVSGPSLGTVARLACHHSSHMRVCSRCKVRTADAIPRTDRQIAGRRWACWRVVIVITSGFHDDTTMPPYAARVIDASTNPMWWSPAPRIPGSWNELANPRAGAACRGKVRQQARAG